MNDKQKDLIREVFLRNGFTIKDGRDDLADYVYAAAHELLQVAPAVQGEPVGWYTEDHLDDKSATTYNAEVAQRWRAKGWPVTPLYLHPKPVPDTALLAAFDAGRRAAQAEAAELVAALVRLFPDSESKGVSDGITRY